MKKQTCRPIIGPGGTKCPCCFPAPGTRERRYEYKKARRKDNQDAMKEGLKEYVTISHTCLSREENQKILDSAIV